MNTLISCEGVARPTKAVGHKVIVPMRIARARCKRWEIAYAVHTLESWDGDALTYRESYWEVPPLGVWFDYKGRRHAYKPEAGVYYYPEAS